MTAINDDVRDDEKYWTSTNIRVQVAKSLTDPTPCVINFAATIGKSTAAAAGAQRTSGRNDDRYWLLPQFNQNTPDFRAREIAPIFVKACKDSGFKLAVKGWERGRNKIRFCCAKSTFYNKHSPFNRQQRCPFQFSVHWDVTEHRWYVDKFGAGNSDHEGHAKEEGSINASSSTTAASADEPVAPDGNLNHNLDDDDDEDHEDESAEEDDDDEGEEISAAVQNEDESIHEGTGASENDTNEEGRELVLTLDGGQLESATAHSDEDAILRKSLRTIGAYNMLKTLFSSVTTLVKNLEGFKIVRRKMLEAREELLLVAQRGERKRGRDDREAFMRPAKHLRL